MLRAREEIEKEIRFKRSLNEIFIRWTKEQQEEFLDFCSGEKGVKILYDSFFKEIMNPEYNPERLNELLSLLLGMEVHIVSVLPVDSTRLADETSLLIMDIVVENEDGSIMNVEVQKIGYRFPGQRSACYSSDLLLRQYKRLRDEKKKTFSYKDIKAVYTIVFFENSPAEFKAFPEVFFHYFEQKSDSGLQLELLQKYLFIPLDIFRKSLHNKRITMKRDAWLLFLSTDRVEDIIYLITTWPEFRVIYAQIYEICRNTEKVMGMFSKELRELDRNTVQYMIDEMQEEINQQRGQLEDQREQLEDQREQLEDQRGQLETQKAQLEQITSENQHLKLRARIWKLHAEGCLPEVIAAQTGLPKEQIQQILDEK